MTGDEVQVVTMKAADENDDSERTPYRQVSQDHKVVTEATADFNKLKKEKLPQQHIANDDEDETGSEEVEPGVQCSGGLINSLSSAKPSGLDLRHLSLSSWLLGQTHRAKLEVLRTAGEALYLHDVKRRFTDSGLPTSSSSSAAAIVAILMRG